MDAREYLADYASRAQESLDLFFETKKKEVRDIGKDSQGASLAVDMLERYEKFSRGGKKLRGALIQLGYELAGGRPKDVLLASISIEVIHSFLLMHDDIEDKDHIRRGFPTIHKQYEDKGDDPHYGISMGINMGDLGAYLGMELILASNINSASKIAASTYFARLLQRVAFGQGLDITYEQLLNVSEKQVFEVHLNKTSIYTIGGPLKIGALLGGMDYKKILAIEKFGEPVGIAFQLRDDELGLFSDEGTLGKPIGGDIREGKNTILKIKSTELAKSRDREFLKSVYGNSNISKGDVRKVQELTIKTGALEYSQKLSKNLVKNGKKYISSITSSKKHQDLLASFADLVIERNS